MGAQGILILYLVFFFLDLGWDAALALLNLSHVKKNAAAVPAAFAGVVDPQTHARSVSYTLTHGRFGLLSGAVSAAAVLAVVLSGFLGYLDGLARSVPVHPWFQGLLLVAAVSLVFSVVRLPFSLYSTFVIEARFGFNRTTLIRVVEYCQAGQSGLRHRTGIQDQQL